MTDKEKTRLEILKKELAQVREFKTLGYSIKEQAIAWYKHEIWVIEELGDE